ncbi:hypothetical protein PHYSODRAFT_326989 [Phytophthora sojae]|uniref:Uncharacterized protein n=1 Tax=Phytophthora sojae (strain P6497) TaxID=1094619 RepID=G4YVM2_PHYSP|nr:hypothetical protein PHYSODRAFT_326989 [Phytophthora sojae]EGZ26054.1 hypothetical protein PHYSODRAFT_326989 [Phytophthora sojae]|eukprot:XP_009521342.1 hypothetical protein PHYSODRAFT_326989 [Phytophthora sojae]
MEAFASTPRPAPVAMRSSPRLRSAGLKKPAKAPTVADPRRASTTTAMSGASDADKPSGPRSRDQEGARTRDQQKAQRYPKLANSSNRLGGGNLADFRDTVGLKRAYEEDEELIEAGYAKAKRSRAAKATAALKKRLSDLESSASTMGGNIFEMMLMMREENERKAEARRMEEEQRRRDELAAREARYLADKAEAVERRRQEKVEIEERARRDKEEARARTQELMLLIGALTKRTDPRADAEGAEKSKARGVVHL